MAKFISVVGGGGKTTLIQWLAALYKQQGYSVCVTTTTKTYLPENCDYDNVVLLNDISKFEHLKENDFRNQSYGGSIHFLYRHSLSTPENEPDKAVGFNCHQLSQIADLNLFDIYLVEADGSKHRPIKAPAGHEPCICDLTDVVIGVTGAEVLFHPASPQQIHRWDQFSALTSCMEGEEISETVLKRLLESPEGLFKHSPQQASRIWVVNKMDLCSEKKRLTNMGHELLENIELLSSVWMTQLNNVQPLIAQYSKTKLKD